ncbi:MAG: 16S rRNA (uracil(1498)-N(3))-methyltransferase [Clostridia bacterium]|nr:16S rRNA (uracil(1498)-N(3))-methyltransferase [Clostridia bacterium]
MHRCFLEKHFNIGDFVEIAGDEATHIQRVLRLCEGDEIEIFCGDGMVSEAVIKSVSKQSVTVEIKKTFESLAEPKTHIVLFQGIAKEAKMDYIIQKATELGISEIVPVETEFSVVKIKDSAKKTERWQKIALEAAKQCKRATVPAIKEPVPFEKAINLLKQNDIYFAPYECEKEGSLKDLLNNKKVKSAGYIIGPEGGFSHKEAQIFKDENIPLVTLGKRILRAETAATATLSVLMFCFGEI